MTSSSRVHLPAVWAKESQRLVPSRRLLPRLSLARGRYSSDTNLACVSPGRQNTVKLNRARTGFRDVNHVYGGSVGNRQGRCSALAGLGRVLAPVASLARSTHSNPACPSPLSLDIAGRFPPPGRPALSSVLRDV